jgi:acyl-CoA thioester hydrolase
MEGYRFVHRRTVEFRDVDAAQHVNNAVYLTYLETARIDYLRQVLAVEDLEQLAVIVANVNVDFRSPALFGETLEIGARVPRVGTKSFEMEHEIRADNGRLVAEAGSVLVTYDYDGGAPMPVPNDWRRRLEAFDARSSVTT